MTQKELNEVLELHKLWLEDNSKGKRADLFGAYLRGANLVGAELGGASLRGADLDGASLAGANLTGADLVGANLRGANLVGAELGGASLRGANLYRADLYRADLGGADLAGADLVGAYLRGADLVGAELGGASLRGANLYRADLGGADLRRADLARADLVGANLTGAKLSKFLIVPEVGQFYGFKKLKDNIIAKLLILEKANRTNSLVGRKCRASSVKVIEFYNLEGKVIKIREAFDSHTAKLVYKKGKIVKPDSYNDDIRIECTNGIHFFITMQEAIEY